MKKQQIQPLLLLQRLKHGGRKLEMTQTNVERRQLQHLARVRSGMRHLEAAWPCDVELPFGVAEPKIDSHLLALAALPYARGSHLDLFSGSGVIGAWLRGRVNRSVLADINPEAVKHLRRQTSDWSHPTTVLRADVFEDIEEAFDIITANPPYVDRPVCDVFDQICFDPNHKAIRTFVSELRRHLRANGSAFVSWADFANFQFLEILVSDVGLIAHPCATLQEPSGKEGSPFIEYRVYRIYDADSYVI
jgi:methylase of polypeptide subunit release factors